MQGQGAAGFPLPQHGPTGFAGPPGGAAHPQGERDASHPPCFCCAPGFLLKGAHLFHRVLAGVQQPGALPPDMQQQQQQQQQSWGITQGAAFPQAQGFQQQPGGGGEVHRVCCTALRSGSRGAERRLPMRCAAQAGT